MTGPHELRPDRNGEWRGPEAVFGVFRSREEAHPFRIQPLPANGQQSGFFVRHARSSVGREPLLIDDITGLPEADWFQRFLEMSGIAVGDVPTALITRGLRGRPVTVLVPYAVNDAAVVVAFRVTDALAARLGHDWLTISADGETMRDVRLASEQEKEWQVDQSFFAVAWLAPWRVIVEAGPPDEANSLALLFEQMDPAGRAEAGRQSALRAVDAFANIGDGNVALSATTAASLGRLAAANLGFAGRLERAINSRRWERLTTDRIQAELGGDAGQRWGVRPNQVAIDGDRLVLDVSEQTALRILRDAFGQSILNGEDLIEGEGRPAERPDILEVDAEE